MPGVDFKRPADSTMSIVPVAKKQKMQIVASGSSVPRTSNLLAPIMLLQGHEGDIFCSKFSPDGSCLASAGFEHKIFLWNVYGECENFAVLSGHTGVVMDLHFTTDSNSLITSSTDKTIRLWDMETGICVRKFKGHSAIINSCHPARRGPQLICSGSDDSSVQIWDQRKKEACSKFENSYQVTSVTFNDTSEQVISGGIDNDLKVWDLRKNDVAYQMQGHSDTVTGLRLSPDGSYVLSNAMDNSVRIWDVRPFAPDQRCLKIFQGNQHNFEKNLLRCCWSPDGEKISAGSADRFVYIWEVNSRKILYKLPGHQGSVNETDFHPNEPIILSAGSDKRIFLGEIE